MIEWTEELVTGMDEVDEQHKLIIKKIGELLQACKAGVGKPEAEEMLSFLMDYCEDHFWMEEQMMKEDNYPFMLSHARQHREFKKSVADLNHDLRENGVTADIVVSLNKKLVGWFVNHILVADIQLGAYLRESRPSKSA